MRRPILIAMLLLFACKKEERVADVANAGATAPGAVASKREAPRMIVRSAEMRIIVADTATTVEAATKSAEAAGGYVAGSNLWREGELLRAKLTLRVPADKLTETLAAIRHLAKRVENETVASSDVSEEAVDLEARVRNLEATEHELLELLKIARSTSKKAADVLEVHQQLTAIRGEIEQAKGRMRYLAQVTAMSSIALDVVPDAIAQPLVAPGWQPLAVLKSASRALVGFLQTAATAAIWFVVCFVPVFGILALAGVAIRKARRLLKA